MTVKIKTATDNNYVFLATKVAAIIDKIYHSGHEEYIETHYVYTPDQIGNGYTWVAFIHYKDHI